MENKHPGSLLNNCSYLLWKERYVNKDIREAQQAQENGRTPKVIPLQQAQPAPGSPKEHTWNHISEWTLRAKLHNQHVVLFGCTEDVYCDNDDANTQHSQDKMQARVSLILTFQTRLSPQRSLATNYNYQSIPFCFPLRFRFLLVSQA